MSDQLRYWFPAKTCGWGWGLASTWEGWPVLLGYLALLALCLKGFPPHENVDGGRKRRCGDRVAAVQNDGAQPQFSGR